MLTLTSLAPRPSASSALLTFELARASSKVKRALEAEGLGMRLDIDSEKVPYVKCVVT